MQVARVAEGGATGRERAAQPATADETAAGQPAQNQLGAADLAREGRAGLELEAVGATPRPHRGLPLGLLLAAGPRQAVGGDDEAVVVRLEPRAGGIEAVGVLEGDDLQADLPAGQVEEGGAEGEAGLRQDLLQVLVLEDVEGPKELELALPVHDGGPQVPAGLEGRVVPLAEGDADALHHQIAAPLLDRLDRVPAPFSRQG